jgi:hypothetical protein
VTLLSGYTGADVGNYLITDQATTTANISAKALSITGSTVAAKTYNGDALATINAGTLSGMITGETLGVSGSGSFNSKDVATATTVAATYLLADGTGLASNYSLAGENLSATITPLTSVTWTGGGGTDHSWATAANWFGGATPNGTNVLQVVINSGDTVVYDNSVGSTTLQSLINNGSLTVADGSVLTVISSLTNTSNFTLNVQGTLDVGYTTNTGTINILGGATPTFNATAGLNNLGIINVGDASGGSSSLNVNGTLDNSGAINSIGSSGTRTLNYGALNNTGVISMSYPMMIGGTSYAVGSVLQPTSGIIDTNVVETITQIVSGVVPEVVEPIVIAADDSEEKKKAEEAADAVDNLQNNGNTQAALALPVCQ